MCWCMLGPLLAVHYWSFRREACREIQGSVDSVAFCEQVESADLESFPFGQLGLQSGFHKKNPVE